jgi:hypothetical protein
LVEYASLGDQSSQAFHSDPDAGATYPDPRANNAGGWIYVSNSESKDSGGVGALTFDDQGRVIDYRMILAGTRKNCGGGRTPWQTWVSCEEVDKGEIWQVDPTREREPEKTVVGEKAPGFFESFAYDVRDQRTPRFFVSKDRSNGELRRLYVGRLDPLRCTCLFRLVPLKTAPLFFLCYSTPINPDWEDPWTMLHVNGTLEYLVLNPTSENEGTYKWVPGLNQGQKSAEEHFPFTEGIDVFENELFFVSKSTRRLFILNLDDGTYRQYTTKHGVFDGQPDQLRTLVGGESDLLYFTEDGGKLAGVHARNSKGQFFTILESSQYEDETTGLSFSPDAKHLYIAYQDNGLLFDITRADGLPFNAKTLNVKYHNSASAV